MQQCSPAEIAEKKRMAMEKLQAKKAQLAAAQKNNNDSQRKTTATTAMPTATTVAATPAVSTSVFYKSPPSNNGTASTSGVVNGGSGENKASAFLNALKQNGMQSYRQEARQSLHPYQRKTATTNAAATYNNKTQAKAAPIFQMAKTSCKIYLISEQRFAVQTSSYNAKVIDVFKTISSKSYDANTRIWSFALKDYQLLQQRVQALKPEVVIGSIPKSVLALCMMPPKELDRSCLESIEPKLADKLMPFQEEGVCFAIAQHGRIMICDEMGLGKTYQALAIADFYKEDWPLLIGTTASTRESWAAHVRELLPAVPISYIEVLSNNQQYIGHARVLISSYNLIEKHMSKLLELKFGCIIFDESHALKNGKAKITSVASRLAMQAKHVVLLSGTPALSRPLELFTQLQIIDRKFLSFVDFTTRYCDGKQTTFGWDATGQSNLQELNVVLKLKYMIRRTKADVLPDLAEKTRETVSLDPALLWCSNDAEETLNAFSKTLSNCKGKQKEEILLKFYAETAKVKTRAVCAYLKTLISDRMKFIVFAHHRIMMDAISDCLQQLRVGFVRIDGATRNETRAENIRTFQTDEKCQVAVLSLKACNSGITLTAAELIVFAELDWNPSTLAQAESRAHRIGQDKRVVCRYLIAPKTADDTIWNMLKAKQDVLNRAGLFCEDLQEAQHSAAPTISKKIDTYFTPEKKKNPASSNLQNTSKQNFDDFFDDDADDDDFRDLPL